MLNRATILGMLFGLGVGYSAHADEAEIQRRAVKSYQDAAKAQAEAELLTKGYGSAPARSGGLSDADSCRKLALRLLPPGGMLSNVKVTRASPQTLRSVGRTNGNPEHIGHNWTWYYVALEVNMHGSRRSHSFGLCEEWVWSLRFHQYDDASQHRSALTRVFSSRKIPDVWNKNNQPGFIPGFFFVIHPLLGLFV